MPALTTVGAVVLFLGGLIFVHELGHFLVAKAFGVKVVRFSIGFGPRFLGFTRGETEYWISAFPLGGYVKMAGDLGDDPERMAPEDRGRGYLDQSPWKRLGISVAGPAMNLIFPFFVYLALAVAEQGHPVAGPYIGMVLPGSAAAVAGLRPGDRILSVTPPGGPARPVRRFADLREVVSPHPDEPLVFRLQRDGQELPPVTITPSGMDDRTNPVETVHRGVLGVSSQYAPALVAPVRPGAAGSLEPFDLVVSAAGKPVRRLPELERIVAGAGCAPIDLEVVREEGIPLPGATVSTMRPLALEAVPTCAAGGPAFLPADPALSTFVGAVEPGSPAARAGIRRGDAIASIDGIPIHTLADLNKRDIALRFGDPDKGGPAPEVRVGLADGRTVTLAAAPQTYVDDLTRKERTRYVPGFLGDDRARGVSTEALSVEQVALQRTPAEMVGAAWEQTAYVVRVIFKGIVKLLTGQASIKNVGGPVSIIKMAKDAAEEGVSSFFFLMGVISVNLALMNLLPIPVLDGGNIAQALLEGVTRRPLSPRTRMVAQAIGLALLVTLMIVVFGNDIARQIVGGKG